MFVSRGTGGMQVLKTLIEDFGGEATCASLHLKIARRGAAAAMLDLRSEEPVQRELDELDRSGAVTLERTRSGQLIARVTPDGAMRAFDEFKMMESRAWQVPAAASAVGA